MKFDENPDEYMIKEAEETIQELYNFLATRCSSWVLGRCIGLNMKKREWSLGGLNIKEWLKSTIIKKSKHGKYKFYIAKFFVKLSLYMPKILKKNCPYVSLLDLRFCSFLGPIDSLSFHSLRDRSMSIVFFEA